MQYKNIRFNVEHSSKLRIAFERLLPLIPAIPPLATLIDEATTDGPITVNIISPDASMTGGSLTATLQVRGTEITLSRTIDIEEGDFKKVISTLIFELCNAKNPYFRMTSNATVQHKNYSDADSFAEAMELAEYHGTYVPAQQLLKAIFSNADTVALLRQHGFDLSDRALHALTHDQFDSFEDYWKYTNDTASGKQVMSHTDAYREVFRKYQRKQARFAFNPSSTASFEDELEMAKFLSLEDDSQPLIAPHWEQHRYDSQQGGPLTPPSSTEHLSYEDQLAIAIALSNT